MMSGVPPMADAPRLVINSVSDVPMDEIATAIAAARGALLIASQLWRVSIVERAEPPLTWHQPNFFDG